MFRSFSEVVVQDESLCRNIYCGVQVTDAVVIRSEGIVHSRTMTAEVWKCLNISERLNMISPSLKLWGRWRRQPYRYAKWLAVCAVPAVAEWTQILNGWPIWATRSLEIDRRPQEDWNWSKNIHQQCPTIYHKAPISVHSMYLLLVNTSVSNNEK